MDRILEFIERYYYSVYALFLGYLLILLFFVVPADDFLSKGMPVFFDRCLFYSALLIVWTVVWFLVKDHFPNSEKNKMGIMVAIATENAKQKIRIRNDFASKIRELLVANDLDGALSLVILNDHQTKIFVDIVTARLKAQEEIKKEGKASPLHVKAFKQWDRIVRRTNGRFFIYGEIVERKDIENKYFLKLNSAIAHALVPFSVSDKIRKEIDAIFPRRISILEKSEFHGFQVSAEMVFIAAKYIIGIGAMISKDPSFAYKIHEALLKDFEKLKPLPAPLSEIANKVRTFLAEELTLMAKAEYVTSRNMGEVNEYLEKALQYDPSSLPAIGTRSYLAFVEERDVVKASRWGTKAKKANNNDFTWLYNQAFMDMYIERFDKGWKKYKKLEKIISSNDDNTVDECIRFDTAFLLKEPDKKQVLFILGWLYYKKKQNEPEALGMFEKFIEETRGQAKYSFLIEIATNYMKEIEADMGLVRPT